MAAIMQGDAAPDLTFSVHWGEQISLKDFQGDKAVVLYFYPKDHSPICAREACAFRGAYEDFVEAGATVIGVSADSDERHRSFAKSHRLPFLLASDMHGTVRRAFGVSKTMGILPGRVTYVIDKKGVVRHVFNAQLLANQHIKQSLGVIRGLGRAHPVT